MGRSAEKNAQQKEQTRARLLDAGRRVVLEKGLRGTKVREIAREAKVGIGTFYAYFPNLEGLLLEATQTALAQILEQVREARGLRDGSAFGQPFRRVRASFQLFFDAVGQYREMFLFLLRQRHGEDAYGRLIRQAFAEFVEELSEDVAVARAAGFGAGPPSRLAAEAILGMSLHVAQLYAEHEDRHPWLERDTVVDTLTELALTGMVGVDPTPQRSADREGEPSRALPHRPGGGSR